MKDIIIKIVLFISIIIVISIIFSLPVMILWNWLMPEIFGLTKITFSQAWGIMVLCSLLFKSSNNENYGK